jgi:hypothetical protein
VGFQKAGLSTLSPIGNYVGIRRFFVGKEADGES